MGDLENVRLRNIRCIAGAQHDTLELVYLDLLDSLASSYAINPEYCQRKHPRQEV